jgi:hypothetical protein
MPRAAALDRAHHERVRALTTIRAWDADPHPIDPNRAARRRESPGVPMLRRLRTGVAMGYFLTLYVLSEAAVHSRAAALENNNSVIRPPPARR